MFFFPIGDDNPTVRFPFVNWAILASCILIFLWQAGLDMREGQAVVMTFGFIPAELFGYDTLQGTQKQLQDMFAISTGSQINHVGAIPSIFSSMFLHGGFGHLIGNMAFLYIYGDNIEDEMGHGRYLLFYLICGVVAAMAQAFAAPSSPVPMIGASGAISGVLGAYLILHPFANIRFFYFLFLLIGTIMLPAWLVLGFWIFGQLMSSAQVAAGEPGVAFMAHVGGFFAGVILVFFFKKKGVKVFQRSKSRAFQSARIRRKGAGSVPPVGRGPWG